MFKNLGKKIFGDPNEREVKRLQPIVDKINALAPEFERMSDDELLRADGGSSAPDRASASATCAHAWKRRASEWQLETDSAHADAVTRSKSSGSRRNCKAIENGRDGRDPAARLCRRARGRHPHDRPAPLTTCS